MVKKAAGRAPKKGIQTLPAMTLSARHARRVRGGDGVAKGKRGKDTPVVFMKIKLTD